MIGIGKDDRSSGRVFQLVKRDRSAVDEHFGMSSVGWGQVEGLARKDVAEQPQANLRTRQGAQVIGMDTEASSGGRFQFDEAPLIGQCSPIDWQVPHARQAMRSEEQKTELQALMRIWYAVYCLKKKK